MVFWEAIVQLTVEILPVIGATMFITLWASVNGVLVGMNVTYSGILWTTMSFVVWVTYIGGVLVSAFAMGYLLTSPTNAATPLLLGLLMFLIPFGIGVCIGEKLVPLLSADVVGRGPVWRWHLQPDDYPLIRSVAE